STATVALSPRRLDRTPRCGTTASVPTIDDDRVPRPEKRVRVAAAFNPMKESPQVVGRTFRPTREESAADAEAGAVRRPRALVDRPEMFGLWGKPMRAAAGVDPADAAFIAANVQHWVANAIREEVAMSRSN